jgi:penicillin-binding protein 1A
MAYAHTNVEIKPVPDLDFVPVQTTVASADTETPAAPAIERPPQLTPAAARKLLDVADALDDALRQVRPNTGTGQATLVVSQATPGK